MKKITILILMIVAFIVATHTVQASTIILSSHEAPDYFATLDIIDSSTPDMDSVTFTLSVGVPDGYGYPETYGDLRGLFFDYTGETDSLAVVGADVTDWGFDGLNNMMKGTGVEFDIGIEIGTPGASPDKIGTTTIVLNNALFAKLGSVYGARITSVGRTPEEEEDSAKLLGLYGELPPVTGSVPEPASLMLFSSALIGAFAKKKFLG